MVWNYENMIIGDREITFCLVFVFRPGQAGIVSTVLSPVSLTPAKNLSAVSLTPVKIYRQCRWQRHFRLFGYFWLLSTTPGNNFIAGVVIDCCDDGGVFFLQNYKRLGQNKDASVRIQQYLQPPGSDAAADGVIGTTMKTRVQRHPPHFLISGVVVTSNKFISCINDTGDHWKSVKRIKRRSQRHPR